MKNRKKPDQGTFPNLWHQQRKWRCPQRGLSRLQAAGHHHPPAGGLGRLRGQPLPLPLPPRVVKPVIHSKIGEGGGRPRNSPWWWEQPQGKGGKGGKGKGRGKSDYWGGYGPSYTSQNYGGKGNPHPNSWMNGPASFYQQQKPGWQDRPGPARYPQNGPMVPPPSNTNPRAFLF